MSDHKIIITKDGSHSILSEKFGVTFHSRHGALQESQHVFINSGLFPLLEDGKKNISILEVGLGTGSSALLTALQAEKHKVNIEYTALEAYPISLEIANSLNYIDLLAEQNAASIFKNIHSCSWSEMNAISSFFSIHKIEKTFAEFKSAPAFDLVYFDAFDPGTQPELWTTEALQPFINSLVPGGLFTTYSAKGAVRRSLQKLGCVVEKIPGPPGKREMLRAIKS